ncbi:MAG: Uma2 family endonuclease [Bacteroidetes bacterium]|nr:MAG: Uma2 family endonuclease [Bacteroidota bacterium]
MVVRLGRKINVLCTQSHQKTEKNVILLSFYLSTFLPFYPIMQTATLISPQEYLEQEAQHDHKHEYHAGEIVAMAGAQLVHNILVANLIRLLGVCADDNGCLVLPSDMLLKLPECEKYVYPDVMIVCETPLLDDEHRQGLEVLLNPTVVIEVTSPSTALFDRTEKMECYLLLASLQQYVLVDSEKVDVITYTRSPQNQWIMQYFTQKTDKATIGDCELLLEDIYRKTGK